MVSAPITRAEIQTLNSIDGIVDLVAVQRLMDGSQIWATRQEQEAAVVGLTAQGVTMAAICRKMHLTKHFVARAVAASVVNRG